MLKGIFKVMTIEEINKVITMTKLAERPKGISKAPTNFPIKPPLPLLNKSIIPRPEMTNKAPPVKVVLNIFLF